MKFLSPEPGQFEMVEEIITQSGLTEKELIPKYHSILDELFRLLTSDEPVRTQTLHERSVWIFNQYAIDRAIAGPIHDLRILANNFINYPLQTPSRLDDLK